MDTVTKEVRSRIMSAVGQRDTKPEMVVRRLVHAMGFRFRLHVKTLPGSPDIVLPRHKKVIFVHGCYWHRHTCKQATFPATRVDFWKAKFDANRKRDRRNVRELRQAGWRVIIIWECQTKRTEWLQSKLAEFLDSDD